MHVHEAAVLRMTVMPNASQFRRSNFRCSARATHLIAHRHMVAVSTTLTLKQLTIEDELTEGDNTFYLPVVITDLCEFTNLCELID
jgi:hypothetical protein